ncbi:type VI secretion protein, partial [Vibrio parahaemolyticus]
RYDPRTNYFDRDISVLSKISQSAAAAFSPFVMSASPEIFGVNTFAELSSTRDVAAQFEQIDYVKWRQLRDNDDTKFIGLTAPNVLFRQPYKSDGS